jgi:hypothetical protein
VVERFAHAVTPAYRSPVDAIGAELGRAGFDVVESHVRTSENQRPQAAVSAWRRTGRLGIARRLCSTSAMNTPHPGFSSNVEITTAPK